MPITVRNDESWTETAPYIEMETRGRGNDSDAPFNVRTGAYVQRHTNYETPNFEATLGTKRSFHVGTLGPAPWKHTSANFSDQTRSKFKTTVLNKTLKQSYDYEHKYVSNRDFFRYSKP